MTEEHTHVERREGCLSQRLPPDASPVVCENSSAPFAENLRGGTISLPEVSSAAAPNLNSPDVTSDEMLVEIWLSRPRSPRTIESYRQEWRRFSNFLKGTRLEVLTVKSLFSYRDELAQQGLAPASQALYLSAVRSLLSFGCALGYLPRDLGKLLESPKVANMRPERILSQETVYKVVFGEKDPRNQLILRLLYAAGVRVSELCGLKVGDLQERTDGGQIIVRGKGSKTRVIPLSQATWDELAVLARDREMAEALFRSQKGGHLTRQHIFRIVKRACARVGAPEAASPHWMRHAHATHALERGCEQKTLQETLGHASLATTGKYLHVRPEDSSAKYLGI